METLKLNDDEILVNYKNVIGFSKEKFKLLININNKKITYCLRKNRYEYLKNDEQDYKPIKIYELNSHFRVYAKVINYEISSKYFGLRTLKSKTVNNIYQVVNFYLSYIPLKFPNEKINLTKLLVNDKIIKYHNDDLEYYIVLKKIKNIINPKANREFVVNCKLKVVNPKHTKLNKNEIVELVDIKRNLKSKRLFYGSKTRALDVVVVKRNDSSLVVSYAKNFKKITN